MEKSETRMAAMYVISGVILSHKRYFIHSNRNGADTYVRYVFAMDSFVHMSVISITFRVGTIEADF